MRFHWLPDRVSQGQFIVFWAPGAKSYADYVSKHHPPQHNVDMRSKFFTRGHLRAPTSVPSSPERVWQSTRVSPRTNRENLELPVPQDKQERALVRAR